jgi:hypothetical protein
MNPAQAILAASGKATDSGAVVGTLVLVGIIVALGGILLWGAIKGGGSLKSRLMELGFAIVAFTGAGLTIVSHLK